MREALMATSSLVVFVPFAYNKIKEEYKKYTDLDSNDLNQLHNYYLECCKDDFLTKVEIDMETISIDADVKSKLTDNINEKVPIYLRLDGKKKLPELYVVTEGQFAPCKDINRWIRRLAKSHLSDAIEEMLGYICEYQRERDKTILKREFSYDPINLFFEEIKVWLLQLSKVAINQKNLLINIDNRIRYLERVKLDQNLFRTQGLEHLSTVDNSCCIRAALGDIIKILRGTIKSTVKDILSRQSAREHFDQLRLEIKYTIKNLIKFLFYVLRNSEASPNFLLEEIRKPTFGIYKNNSLFVLDSILGYLVCSTAVTEIFPTIMDITKNDLVVKSKYSDFLKNDEIVCLPVLPAPLSDITKSDLWRESLQNVDTGIHKIFLNQDSIDSFLKLCGYIQRLCLCHRIVDEFFDLAGEGGNLFVYRFAANEIQPLLAQMDDFFETIIKISERLQEIAKIYYDQYFSNRESESSKELTKQDKIWAQQFIYAKEAHDTAINSLSQSKKVLIEMHSKLKEVNSVEYQENVRKKIANLKSLLKNFQDINLLRQEKKESIDNNLNPQNEYSNMDTQKFSLKSSSPGLFHKDQTMVIPLYSERKIENLVTILIDVFKK